MLSDEGYDATSMFPGYDGVVSFLREKELHESG
jgi:hypothetical protein